MRSLLSTIKLSYFWLDHSSNIICSVLTSITQTQVGYCTWIPMETCNGSATKSQHTSPEASSNMCYRF